MPVKRLIMVKRRVGLTPEEFRDGYENSHSRMAVELFGHLWLAYRRNYLLTGRNYVTGWGDGPDEVGFDAVSEFILPDEAALEEMNRIAAANYDLIKADEALWFDQIRCWNMGCETIEEDLSGRHDRP